MDYLRAKIRKLKVSQDPSDHSKIRPSASASSLPQDLPPSYGEVTGPHGASASVYNMGDDNEFAFLATFDTILLIDDSGSMAGSSWREVETVLANITPICTKYDTDGIEVYFLNHQSKHPGNPKTGKAKGGYNVDNDTMVERLFNSVRPTAATPTGARINAILNPYLRYYETQCRDTNNPDETGVKPVNLIVITDGAPTDDLKGVLKAIARKLDQLGAPSFQVGVQFFQVGSFRSAAEALRNLDDNLGDVRDMVDTVSWDTKDGEHPALTADAMLKTVLGAVNRRIDRKNLLRIVVDEH